MKKYYYRLRVMLMTLAFGLASVWFFNGFSAPPNEIKVNLPETFSASPIVVIPADKPFIIRTLANGCGGKNIYGGKGAGNSFISPDGDVFSFDSSCHDKSKQARRELKLRLNEADRIVENKYLDQNSKAQRIVLESNGSAEILKFDGEKCIQTLSAPTLKLALKFEEWQKSRN